MRNVVLFLLLFQTNLLSAQVVFDKGYGGVVYSRFGRNVELANNNGYLINASLGTPYVNTVLYRLNSNGDTLWTRRFGNDSIQYKTYDMLGISNGRYLMCGDYQHVNEPFSMDSYLMEIDSLGHVVWFNEYGVTNNGGSKDYASDVLQLANGNIVTIGSAKHSYTEAGTIQNYGLFQGYVHLFDNDGDSLRAISLVHYFTPSSQLWEHRYYCNDAVASGNRVCIVGERWLHNQTAVADTGFVLIVDANLDTIASVNFPINRSLISVDATPQGTFIVFGDDLLAEVDSNGTVLWQRQIVLNSWRYTKVGVRQNGEIVVLESANGEDIVNDVQPSNCNANGMVILHTLDNAGNEICADSLSIMPSGSTGMVDFILEGDSTTTLTGGNGNLRLWVVQYNGRGHGMTNIHSLQGADQTGVFPNPSDRIINVKGVNSNSQYSILNAAGQVVLSSKFENAECNIDVSQLPSGFYLIQCCDEKGTLSTTSFIRQ